MSAGPTTQAAGRAGAAETGSLGLGVALMASGALVIPGIDAIAKTLGSGDPAMPAVQIAFFRFLAQMALLAPLAVALGGWAALHSRRPLLMGLRGLLIAAASIFFFAALRVMPMAETVAIFFVEPLLLTMLSAVFLRERVGWRRVAAILVGLLGAVLIVRPSFAEVGPAALLPLGAAFCFALYLLLTKLMSDENPLTLQVWSSISALGALGAVLLLGASLTAAGAAPDWASALAPIAPTLEQWALLGLLGLVATGSHFLIVIAFRHAPASTLAPFQYLEIVSATLLGWWIFGDFPDPATGAGLATWAGVVLIVGSGLFVFARERRAARQPLLEDSR